MTRHFRVEEGTPRIAPGKFGASPFRKLVRRVECMQAATQYLIAVFLIAVIGLVDFSTGFEVQLSILYLIPVSMIAWHRGWGPARVVAVVAMLVWMGADQWAGHSYSSMPILFWNTAVRGAFFLLFALVLAHLRDAVDEEQRLARTDSLTGVANSRSFLETTEHEVRRQGRYGKPLSIAFLDCDNFKEVNDRYGHAMGDELLQNIASCMHACVRSVDTVARLGGDEFAVLLPETDAHAADIVCEKVREALRVAVAKYGVTFSIGVVTYYLPPVDVEDMLHNADQAMYEAK
ncbi:MAG TPA: GGDEF domain-containing protein, partial [Longimicrobiales bacterium]|nr:GGDEF domain-containing protein [Longimicrobiales bacterium]